MVDTQIGRLVRVPLRDVWKHEAYGFTLWLQENVDVLGSALDMTLLNVEREQAAGSFSMDLVAEDDEGSTVVIENQLEKSDHDHLGKLITYLAAIDADTAIWIVANPRPEHTAAISWLNESGIARFYMVKLETVRIDGSAIAPLFTLIAGPSAESDEEGQTDIAGRTSLRRRWWRRLIAQSATISKLHAHITPSARSTIGVTAGVRGLLLNYVATRQECGVELYIDRGKDSDGENKRIFEQLYLFRSDIEKAFGAPLSWERSDDRRACRIRYKRIGGYGSPEEAWAKIQDDVIESMNRLAGILKPVLELSTEADYASTE
jgi:Domain of unknown function (DUF4268)